MPIEHTYFFFTHDDELYEIINLTQAKPKNSSQVNQKKGEYICVPSAHTLIILIIMYEFL